jgi:uncharacterized protein (TIGR00297 family)
MNRGEWLRKALHIGVGAGALLLRWLDWWQMALCCLAGFAFNRWVLAAWTKHRIERPEEHGRPIGVWAYPLTLAALCLVFARRLDAVAVAWAVMAFGDGFATITGKLLQGPRLPWNPKKTVSGFFAFILFGSTAAWFALAFVETGSFALCPGQAALAACFFAAVCAAFMESYPSGLDDNIAVAASAALAYWSAESSGLLWALSREFAALHAEAFVQGGMLTALLATLAYGARLVSAGGFLGGWAVGTLVYGFSGWRGFLLLCAFFVLASAATKFGYKRKAALGIAQSGGGARGARHAFANAAASIWLAACGAAWAFSHELAPHAWRTAFAAALATALFDTLGTEIGQVYGRTPVLLTTFRRGPPGTAGAVSLEGTLAGLAGALALGALAWGTGFVPPLGVAAVATGAFAGAVFESFLLSFMGKGRLEHEFSNFMNTVVGGAVGYAVFAVVN